MSSTPRATRRAEQTSGRRWLPDHPLAFGLAVGLAYAAVAKAIALVPTISSGGESVASFWPLSGLTFVATMLTRPRWWPWVLGCVFTAEVLVDLSGGIPLPTAVGWGVADVVEPLVSVSLLIWIGHRRLDLSRTDDLLRFVACAVLAQPAAGALVAGTASALTGFGPFGESTIRWLASAATGVLVVAPALLSVADRRPGARVAARPDLMLVVLAVTLLAFNPTVLGHNPALPYLIAPALMWLAVRTGSRGAAYGVLLMALVVDVTTALGWGAFATSAGAFSGLVTAQVFLGSMAFSALLVGALTSHLFTGRQLAARVHQEALHDPLTGLPNRRMFTEQLASAGARRRPGRSLAVLFADLNGFKEVNDALGHDTGDEVLARMASRLIETVRAGDLVARLGGDEFAVLAEGITDVEEIRSLAGRLTLAVADPMLLRGIPVQVWAAVGTAVSDDRSVDPELLLATAENEMDSRKQDMPPEPLFGRKRWGHAAAVFPLDD